jgi:peroxiredoxin
MSRRELALGVAALAVVLLAASAAAEEEAALDSRPCLGVKIQTGSLGAEIVELFPGFPAELAGMAVADQIVAVDGERVASGQALSDLLLNQRRVGEEVELTVRRAARTLHLRAVLDRFPGEEELFRRRLVDHPAPDFDLPAVRRGGRLSLRDLRGQVIALALLPALCLGPCQEQLAQLAALAEEQTPGLSVVAVAGADAAHLGLALAQNPGVEIIYDEGKLVQAYHLARPPALIVIDRDGVVRFAGMGALGGVAAARPALNRALRERNGIALPE